MVYIIAEIGNNHEGSFTSAVELIKSAAATGVDAVKFQTYEAEKLVHPSLPALAHASTHRTQLERLKSLQFSFKQWHELWNLCQEYGVDFLTTCFDEETLTRFAPHLPLIKIASGDITHHSLIRKAAEYGKPVFLSTGMASLLEIEQAVALIPSGLATVLHCVSCYPTPPNQAALSFIPELRHRFSRVGYSDHTKGSVACLAAVALGAKVIEKHFTLTPNKAWGDHPHSIDPIRMEKMVKQIRVLEEMLGPPVTPCGQQNRKLMRRGAYAARDINAGEVLMENDILALRPATATAPYRRIGWRARRDYKKLEALD